MLHRFRTFHGADTRTHPLAPEQLYTQDVEFHDPVRTLLGILALKRHLRTTKLCKLEYLEEIVTENSATLSWRAQMRHPLLPGKRTVMLRGITQLRFTDRIYYQEDFYDLGSTVYQRLPLIGPLIRVLCHSVWR